MRIHILSVPHTIATRTASHCAFTQKSRLLSRMLVEQGYDVTFYGVQGADVVATTVVALMEQDEHQALLKLWKRQTHTDLVGAWADTGSPVYRQSNFYLRAELIDRLMPGDALCLPFGPAHETAYRGLPLVESKAVGLIETGIGYPNPCTHTRVYESEAWRHWIMGHEHRNGTGWESPRLEWVVPNGYDVADWPDESRGGMVERSTVVFFGRLIEAKGLDLIPRLALARPDLTFVLCGQGDPGRWLTEPNIVYRQPIEGLERSTYLSRARAAIFPSRYVEPFCGAAVEAMLCGTPVIASDFGAFTETVLDGVSGVRCRSFDQWVAALDRVLDLPRDRVRDSATRRYGLPTIGRMYGQVFAELGESLRQLPLANTAIATSGSVERSTVHPRLARSGSRPEVRVP